MFAYPALLVAALLHLLLFPSRAPTIARALPRSSARIGFWLVCPPGYIGAPEARVWQPWPRASEWRELAQNLARTARSLVE